MSATPDYFSLSFYEGTDQDAIKKHITDVMDGKLNVVNTKRTARKNVQPGHVTFRRVSPTSLQIALKCAGKIDVIDTQGKSVKTMSRKSAGQYQVSFDDVRAGLYLVKVGTEMGNAAHLFTVMK